MYDVCVIGAGVVGSAVARLLSHQRLNIVLVDASNDVGAGTSKANTAILHTGFDATPGSIEAGLVARGYAMLRAYAPSVGIALEETGAVLVAWTDDQAAALPALIAKAHANGYDAAALIDAAEVREREPRLGDGVVAGMVVPGEHIIDPWSTPIAFAREAIANGATWRPGCRVTGFEFGDEHTVITAERGEAIEARFVVNAAGLFSDVVNELAGASEFTVRPRRGELIVFDKLARPLLHGTVLPVPTATTKGVLVAPTVFGNVMVGPTADDIDDKTATGSTRAGIDALVAHARRILPALADEEVTSVYAGLRAATEHSDYQLAHRPDLRYVCLGGIRSTGLTASMALAEETLRRLVECGLASSPKSPDEIAPIRMTNLGEAGPRPYQQPRNTGIVCHCERVTRDEIVAACTTAPGATDLDGVRRRTRAVAGRCQGFACLAEVCTIAATATSTTPASWLHG